MKIISIKSVQTSLFVVFCTLISTTFIACSSDDEPGNPSIYGLWERNDEPDSYYNMLITKDCIAMFYQD